MQQLTTNISLILRLQNKNDSEAWDEFVTIYQPLIERIARRLGLTGANLADCCQEVMIRLSEAVKTWSSDSQHASFRRWLYRVARNSMLNQISSMQRQREVGCNNLEQDIGAVPASEIGSAFDIEFFRQSLIYLAEKIRPDFNPINWSAFWMTYANQSSIQEAAEKLGICRSRVYVARSRIIKRLREEASRLSESDWYDLEAILLTNDTERSFERLQEFAKGEVQK